MVRGLSKQVKSASKAHKRFSIFENAMIAIIKLIIRSVFSKLYVAINPVGYARSVGVKLGENVQFYGAKSGMFGSEPWLISIGNNCYITAGVQFVNHDGGTLILRKEVPNLEWTAPICIGDDVYIGMRTIILPNVSIGSRCIIGAGSVVSKNVPDNSVFAGVPARRICSTDEYLEKLKAKSLGCGHLRGSDKAVAIKKYYHDRGWS